MKFFKFSLLYTVLISMLGCGGANNSTENPQNPDQGLKESYNGQYKPMEENNCFNFSNSFRENGNFWIQISNNNLIHFEINDPLNDKKTINSTHEKTIEYTYNLNDKITSCQLTLSDYGAAGFCNSPGKSCNLAYTKCSNDPFKHNIPECLSPDVKDDIATLFLGLGPNQDIISANGGCMGINNQFTTWADSSFIHIIVSESTMPKEHIESLQANISKIETVTSHRLKADLSITSNPHPQPQEGEITAYAVDDPRLEGCGFAQGCAIGTFKFINNDSGFQIIGGKFVSGKNNAPQATLHDVMGHLALGLCHLNSDMAQENPSLMAFGKDFFNSELPNYLSKRDINAIQMVYASPLTVGATPTDFVNQNLIKGELITKENIQDQNKMSYIGNGQIQVIFDH